MLAIEEFVKQHENRRIFEPLNEVYGDAPSPDEELLHKGWRRQQKQLVEGQ
jgi:hypothetical protein